MANLAILASGNGSNFEAIAESLADSDHKTVCMICDRKDAGVFKRAERLGVEGIYIPYYRRNREAAETDMIMELKERKTDLIALAGFMRLLTPVLIDSYPGRIINIHPSLLPKYPGTHGILDSFESGDSELGITIHRVDYGLDTGPVIVQKSFNRSGEESLDEIESKIHELEHLFYPAVLRELLDSV